MDGASSGRGSIEPIPTLNVSLSSALEPPIPPDPPIVSLVMTWDSIKRMLKVGAGFLLLPIGVVMLPLPGPGWLVIFVALAILAGEFVWARNLMDRLKQVGARLDPRKPKL